MKWYLLILIGMLTINTGLTMRRIDAMDENVRSLNGQVGNLIERVQELEGFKWPADTVVNQSESSAS